MFGAPTSDNVSVSSNQLTFNDPNDPTTPFDPWLQHGRSVRLPRAGLAPATTGITGLTPGTVYYVITTRTPGVIQLADSYADAEAGTALPISLPSGSTTTNINYTVPFTPADTRPLVVTQFGGIDTATMSFPHALHGLAHHADPLQLLGGVNVTATLSDTRVLVHRQRDRRRARGGRQDPQAGAGGPGRQQPRSRTRGRNSSIPARRRPEHRHSECPGCHGPKSRPLAGRRRLHPGRAGGHRHGRGRRVRP